MTEYRTVELEPAPANGQWIYAVVGEDDSEGPGYLDWFTASLHADPAEAVAAAETLYGKDYAEDNAERAEYGHAHSLSVDVVAVPLGDPGDRGLHDAAIRCWRVMPHRAA